MKLVLILLFLASTVQTIQSQKIDTTIVSKKVNCSISIRSMVSALQPTNKKIAVNNAYWTVSVIDKYQKPLTELALTITHSVTPYMGIGIDQHVRYIYQEPDYFNATKENYFQFPALIIIKWKAKFALLESISLASGKTFGGYKSGNGFYKESNLMTSELVFKTTQINLLKTRMKLELLYNFNSYSNTFDFDKTGLIALSKSLKGMIKYTTFRHYLGLGMVVDII